MYASREMKELERVNVFPNRKVVFEEISVFFILFYLIYGCYGAFFFACVFLVTWIALGHTLGGATRSTLC